MGTVIVSSNKVPTPNNNRAQDLNTTTSRGLPSIFIIPSNPRSSTAATRAAAPGLVPVVVEQQLTTAGGDTTHELTQPRLHACSPCSRTTALSQTACQRPKHLNPSLVCSGTNRAARYIVLLDELGMGPDAMQLFTYWMCYLYCRCTRWER